MSYEKLSTEAGEFWAFKVHLTIVNLGQDGGSTGISYGEADSWLSPEVKGTVKYENSWETSGVLLEFRPGPVETISAANSNVKINNSGLAEVETESRFDTDTLETSLAKLKRLVDKGLIPADEAENWRRELLGLPPVADVPTRLPAAKNPDAVAVIIGNRNYDGRIPAGACHGGQRRGVIIFALARRVFPRPAR
ncbi:MAG: hypothetical protein QF449_13800 [Alphaproteobacteria bacterium]|jgi:hypothetical protein|nr:hypothetical protein [Alphaproteobacteria bacterium]